MISKPSEQLWLSFSRDNCDTLANYKEHPVEEDLLERILERDNLKRALRQVERNSGSAGIDGMTVKELRPFIKLH